MHENRLNILITAPSFDPGINVSGVSAVAQIIVNRNDAHNYHHYRLGRPDKSPFPGSWMLLLFWQLLRLAPTIVRKRIDLVHLNFPFDPKGIVREYFTVIICRLTRRPVLLHIHGGINLMNRTDNRFYLFLIRRILNRSAAVIALSEADRRALERNYGYDRALTLENTIDVSEYAALTADKHASTLLFLGRLHEDKGLMDIVAALRKLKDEGEQFRLIVCGDGPLRGYVEREFGQLLGDRFQYRGIVAGRAKAEALAEAGIFLLPSFFEGMPMSLLEAMAAGLVPVVSDIDTLKAIVSDGQNGFVVARNNPGEISGKIKILLHDAELYKIFSDNARSTIIKTCDVKDYFYKLNRIYDNAIKKVKH
jgi:glycosyltransferase involved in cell wall biosynthesis